jgi:phage shock protein PspC (stress-responsive transcriptional regulator)
MHTAPDETPDPTGAGPTGTGPTGTGPTSTGPTGAPTTEQAPPPPHAPSTSGYGGEQRLHRGGRGRMLAGVAVGLADYFDVDPTIVRVGFVALAFLGGLAVPLYLAGWLLIPDEDSDVSVAEELLARERARGAF